MKTYTTLDMIAEARKDTKKQFHVLGKPRDVVGFKNGILVWRDIVDESAEPWRVVITDSILSDMWVEAEPPVSWQEAIRAWHEDGKGFRVEIDGEIVFEQASVLRLGLTGSDDLRKLGFIPSWFKHGKWYIE